MTSFAIIQELEKEIGDILKRKGDTFYVSNSKAWYKYQIVKAKLSLAKELRDNCSKEIEVLEDNITNGNKDVNDDDYIFQEVRERLEKEIKELRTRLGLDEVKG